MFKQQATESKFLNLPSNTNATTARLLLSSSATDSNGLLSQKQKQKQQQGVPAASSPSSLPSLGALNAVSNPSSTPRAPPALLSWAVRLFSHGSNKNKAKNIYNRRLQLGPATPTTTTSADSRSNSTTTAMFKRRSSRNLTDKIGYGDLDTKSSANAKSSRGSHSRGVSSSTIGSVLTESNQHDSTSRPVSQRMTATPPMAEWSPSGDAPPAVVDSAPVTVKKAPKLQQQTEVPKEQPAKTLVIGAGVFFEGMTEGCVLTIVGGKFRGTVNSRRVEVTKEGKVEGAAIAETAEIAGVFEGNLAVSKSLKICSTGRVKGDVSFGSIVVENGGKLEGQINFSSARPTKTKTTKTTATADAAPAATPAAEATPSEVTAAPASEPPTPPAPETTSTSTTPTAASTSKAPAAATPTNVPTPKAPVVTAPTDAPTPETPAVAAPTAVAAPEAPAAPAEAAEATPTETAPSLPSTTPAATATAKKTSPVAAALAAFEPKPTASTPRSSGGGGSGGSFGGSGGRVSAAVAAVDGTAFRDGSRRRSFSSASKANAAGAPAASANVVQ